MLAVSRLWHVLHVLGQQKEADLLEITPLEKLFGLGGEWSKGTVVALSNGFWESEVIGAMNIDMLETQRS
jgi:hypothetical protein